MDEQAEEQKDFNGVDISNESDVFAALDKLASESGGAEPEADDEEAKPAEEGEAAAGSDEEKPEEGLQEVVEAAAQDDEKKETKSEPKDEPLDEPQDHGERSRLGRRMVRIEDTLAAIQSQIAAIATVPAHGQPEPQSDEDEYFDPPSTKAEFEQMVAKAVEKRTNAQIERVTRYKTAYTSSFLKLADQAGLSDEDAAELWNEMSANHRATPTGRPDADVLVNFSAATLAMLKKGKAKEPEKEEKPENPFKGGKPVAPLGGAPVSRTDMQSEKPIKLDPVSADFVKRMGISEDEVRKALLGGESRQARR